MQRFELGNFTLFHPGACEYCKTRRSQPGVQNLSIPKIYMSNTFVFLAMRSYLPASKLREAHWQL